MNGQQATQRFLLVAELPKVISSIHLLAQSADLYSSHEEKDHEVVDRYERLHLALEGVEAVLVLLQQEFDLTDPEINDRKREVK